MTKIQLDLDGDDNEIIECCKFEYGLKSKEDTIKRLIKNAGKKESIKTLLKKREKQIKNK